MEKTITVKQAVMFVDAYNLLKDSGVAFKGLAALDLADNALEIEKVSTAFQKATEAPKEYSDYIQKMQKIQLTAQANKEDPAETAKKFEALEKECAGTLSKMGEINQSKQEMFEATREINVVEIPRDAIIIADEKNVKNSTVLLGLSLVLEGRK